MTHGHGLAHQHDPALVVLAALLCVAGAWATSRFFQRLADDGGSDGQRFGWLFLTALASGVTIWCTHFVAILAFHAGGPVHFDPLLTAASLLVAVLCSAVGLVLAGRRGGSRLRPAVGGVVVGLSIASMHYVGMSALRLPGSISWDAAKVGLSVGFAVVLSAAAVHAGRRPTRHAANLMWALFVLAVLLLHFTGMSAMRITLAADAAGPADRQSLSLLAITIAVLSLVTIGAGVAGYLIDNRTRSSAVEGFRRLAMHDILTGLPNRASFNERLAAEISRARQQNARLALVVIDVDDFKQINDLRGHAVGDEVLSVLGRRLSALAHGREGGFVARVGGDEFVALVRPDATADLAAFLERLHDAMSELICLGTGEIVPRASIGAAVYPDDAADAEALVSNADLAMYRAKRDPLHHTCLYDASVDEVTRLKRGLAADLREALGRGELFLHYQVQTEVSTGVACGYEALLRWHHPQLGLVSPLEFIPLAEESGLIIPIGEWVLHAACTEAASWEVPYRVAVNVSAVQLAEPGLVEAVRGALAASELPASRLELELTESAVVLDRERARQRLEEIKGLGVSIAMDDYGVGYSSLDVLRAFPFDRIKIDRSLFSGAGSAEQTAQIVESVLALGRTLGMSVLAEGVETEDQLAILSRAGCHEAQGYLFGRPALPTQSVRR